MLHELEVMTDDISKYYQIFPSSDLIVVMQTIRELADNARIHGML